MAQAAALPLVELLGLTVVAEAVLRQLPLRARLALMHTCRGLRQTLLDVFRHPGWIATVWPEPGPPPGCSLGAWLRSMHFPPAPPTGPVQARRKPGPPHEFDRPGPPSARTEHAWLIFVLFVMTCRQHFAGRLSRGTLVAGGRTW